MTGLSLLLRELNTKRLELLKEAVPSLTRVGVLVNADHPLRERLAREIDDGARALKLELRFAHVSPADPLEKLDASVEALAREGVGGVIGLQGSNFYRDRKRLAELALRHRFPSVFEAPENVEAGALLGYGANMADVFRRPSPLICPLSSRRSSSWSSTSRLRSPWGSPSRPRCCCGRIKSSSESLREDQL